jgi:hypothetical protein
LPPLQIQHVLHVLGELHLRDHREVHVATRYDE